VFAFLTASYLVGLLPHERDWIRRGFFRWVGIPNQTAYGNGRATFKQGTS